jgi:glycosyltransferase A (GT-A) superfamily protein (DUF2064 family)
VVALVALAAEFAVALPMRQAIGHLVDWIRSAGATGVAVYAAVYIVFTVLLIPGSILTAGAGLAYGPWLGLLLVSPVSMAAATISFVLGRTVARGWIARGVAADPRFRAVDAAVGQRGFRIVLLLRLSPLVAFNVLNYALGLTGVHLRDYIRRVRRHARARSSTCTRLAQGTVVCSAGGDAGGVGRRFAHWAGLAATVAVTIYVTRVARRALTTELGPATRSPPVRRSCCRAACVREAAWGHGQDAVVSVLGDEGAAAWRDTFRSTRGGRRRACRKDVVLAATDVEAPEWHPLHATEVWPQGAGTLGDRLERVLRRALQTHPFVIAIGTDVPGLPLSRLGNACEALRTADAVVGPADDGGFYLIGVSACPHGLLDTVPWSASDTCARTLKRLRQHHLATTVIAPWFDVDTPADLDTLRRRIRDGTIHAGNRALMLSV